MKTTSTRTLERARTNLARFDGRAMPCPVCGTERPVRLDRRGKPFVVCNACGVQLFVRRQEGIDRLAAQLDAPEPATPQRRKPATMAGVLWGTAKEE